VVEASTTNSNSKPTISQRINYIMGSAASLTSKRYSTERDDISKCSSMNSSKSNYFTERSSTTHRAPLSNEITPQDSDMAYQSWKIMSRTNVDVCGEDVFVDDFFTRVLRSEHYDLIERMFLSPTKTKDVMFVDFIMMLVSIDKESWNIKKYLRATGRSFAARGVRLEQLEAFKKILLDALAHRMSITMETLESMRAWERLLTFAVREMDFEKVVFYRYDSSKDPNVSGATSTTESGNSAAVVASSGRISRTVATLECGEHSSNQDGDGFNVDASEPISMSPSTLRRYDFFDRSDAAMAGGN